MQHPFMLAQSTDELVYIIAVLIFIGAGWVAERVKAKMAEKEQQARPRSGRRPPTSLPRPEIDESRLEPSHRPAPAAPPPGQRPRPPVRPPTPARPAAAEPARRDAAPPRQPAARPVPARTAQEARTIIRGQPTPARPARAPASRGTPTPARPQPQPAAQAPEESWARLAQWGGQDIRAEAEARQLGHIKPAEAVEAAIVRGRVGAESFRRLTRADLQRAFVLKEILDPPIALREESETQL